MNEHRKIADDIANRLREERNMPIEQRAALESLHKRADKWARMEEGDVDALVELLYERGMWSKKDFEEYQRNKNNQEYD